MRSFNFDVRFAQQAAKSPSLRVVLNERFDPAILLNDFPKNMLEGYARIALGGMSLVPVPAENAIDVSFGHALTDADRAILLNLMDFGQDHEEARSTTLDHVIVYGSDVSTGTGLQEALSARNNAAVERMTALMSDFVLIEEEEFDRTDWPTDLFWRYFYTVIVETGGAVTEGQLATLRDAMETLNAASMWLAFNPDMTVREAAEQGLSGISSEISSEDGTLTYIVERPGSNPALPVSLWLDLIAEQIGGAPSAMQINVTEEP